MAILPGGLIRRFGGLSALAQLLGKRQSTVEHWARTGRIPAQWHQAPLALARQRGIILEAGDSWRHPSTTSSLPLAGWAS